MTVLLFSSFSRRLNQVKVNTSLPEAAVILKSVQKKTKIFGCKLDEYTKVRLK